MAREELTRVTQMTHHMLAFHREAEKPVPIKIGEVLDNVTALYERKIESAGIQVKNKWNLRESFSAYRERCGRFLPTWSAMRLRPSARMGRSGYMPMPAGTGV